MKTKRIPVLSHRYLVAGSGSGGGHCWPENLPSAGKLWSKTLLILPFGTKFETLFNHKFYHTHDVHIPVDKHCQNLAQNSQLFTLFLLDNSTSTTSLLKNLIKCVRFSYDNQDWWKIWRREDINQ